MNREGPMGSPIDGNEPANADVALRLQILATEHWSLLASRNLAWNESFSRATMYLATLSGAVVALALVAQASQFGRGFAQFAIVILPVVLFVGVTTLIRLGAANHHDAMCVVGMNRIRHAYLEIAPELKPYFVMGTSDDYEGVALTMAVPGPRMAVGHFLSATPTVISVLNAIVAGGIAFAAASLGETTTVVRAVTTGLVFVLTIAVEQWFAIRSIAREQASYHPMFPGKDGVSDEPVS